MTRIDRLVVVMCILPLVSCGSWQAQPTQAIQSQGAPTLSPSTTPPATQSQSVPPAPSSTPPVTPGQLVPATPASTAPATFPYTGVASFCDIPNFAWTIGNALARSAQPRDEAWRCLKQEGFTTIIRQNVEGDDGSEKSAVESLGMQSVGSYAIPDDTAYSPATLQLLMQDVVTRLKRGERILVHDSGGRGRMGFWEAAFLMWDGWTSNDALDRYVAFGWKINGGPGLECPADGIDPTDVNGSNGQYQAIQIVAQALGQPSYDPSPDTYGYTWANCAWPADMSGWNYSTIQWPAGQGGRWSITGIIVP